jgi:hypothetical protein
MKTSIISVLAIFLIIACSCKKHAATNLEKISGDHSWSGTKTVYLNSSDISFSGKITAISNDMIIFSSADIALRPTPETLNYISNTANIPMYASSYTATGGKDYEHDTIKYIDNTIMLSYNSMDYALGIYTQIRATAH